MYWRVLQLPGHPHSPRHQLLAVMGYTTCLVRDLKYLRPEHHNHVSLKFLLMHYIAMMIGKALM
ncbi:hypothetical protein BJR06_30370 [Bacillus cereus]|nr:hypothetical protein BJR06_30370 [Bacillus cereus]